MTKLHEKEEELGGGSIQITEDKEKKLGEDAKGSRRGREEANSFTLLTR